MTLRDLPPLGLLLTFEAAGRLLSFKAAAQELHLTPSAISQQIKALEGALGVVLFVRAGRAVDLTPGGARYLEDVRSALGELARAGKRLRRPDSDSVLRLSTAPLTAHEFLVPRLADFQGCFPELDLHIETSSQLADLAAGELDAAIRVGGGSWSGLTARPFGRIEIAPVCAPSLARTIRSKADLLAHPLIVVRGQERAHEPFLGGGSARARPRRTLGFDSCFEAMRAAELGLGVAIGVFPVITAWVLDERLAVPLAERELLAGTACLVYRASDEERFPYLRIAQWMRERYDALPELPSGRLVAA